MVYDVHMSEVVSVRLPEEVARRLREQAAGSSDTVSGIAQRLVDEGLRMDAHPGVVFRPGPSGRRAALACGPDVWEVVSLVRSLDARSDEGITEAAHWLGLSEAQIRIALGYYGDYPDEIDADIQANEDAARRARESWDRQQQLLR